MERVRLKPLEQVAALGAGLAVGSAEERGLMGEALVALVQRPEPRSRLLAAWRRLTGTNPERASRAAARALVSGWSMLPLSARRIALRECGAALMSTARALGCAGASIAALARDSREPVLMSRIAGLLVGESADLAEEAVVRIAAAASAVEDRLLGLDPEAGIECHRAGGWDEASAGLLTILQKFAEHRRSGALLAAAAMLGPQALAYGGAGDLGRWLREKEDAAQLALRTALRRSTGALWRLRAWEWLTREGVAAAAMERLARGASAAEHVVVLERSHLVANPERGRRTGLIVAGGSKGRHGVLPGPEMLAALPVAARRGMPRLARALKLSPAALDRAVAPLLQDDDAAVRWSAAGALGGDRVAALCADTDPRVAGSAALRCAVEQRGRVAELIHSPHRRVQRLARDEAARRTAWGPEWSPIEARRVLADDRAEFTAELRRRISAASGGQPVGAIMLARRLGLQAEVELELLAASCDADERTAATAAAALGEVRSVSGRDAVRRLVQHGAARVRANAAEALVRGLQSRPEAGAYAAAIELKRDTHHRVRANAIRGLLVSAHGFEPAAAEGLSLMLGDERPLHRLAALWAAERVLLGPAGEGLAAAHWNEMSARVAEMARGESEGPVRARAVRCAARMLWRMRGEWERRAAGAEGVA